MHIGVGGLTAGLLSLSLVALGSPAAGIHQISEAADSEPTASTTETTTETQPAYPPALERFYAQEPTWTSCGQGNECARIIVPLDYAVPEGATVELSVRRTVPQSADQEALFINPGGPGVAGTSYVNYVANLVDSRVRSTYSIVGFDPRGVGNSTPVVCVTGRETTRWYRTDSTPNSPAERRTLLNRAAAISPGCLQRSPEIAPHVGTDNAVRDMDILRAVVNQDTLNWLGFSYGTYLGTRYLELFPDRAGRMVLDGPVDPSLDSMQLSKDQSRGFQVAIERYARDCVTRRTCPYGPRATDVLRGINDLLARLDVSSMRTQNQLRLVESEALTALFTAMYTPDFWPTLTGALNQAKRGDGTGLQNLAALANDQTGTYTYSSNALSAFLAIVCWDSPPPPGAQGLARAATAWSRGAKVPAMARSMSWGNAPCSTWFGHSAQPPAPAQTTSQAPVLMIGTKYDPATPMKWAEALHAQLPTSTLLTYNGDGHTAFGAGSRCVDAAVNNYLLTGALPPAGTVCN